MENLYRWCEKRFGWRKEETDQNVLVAGILLAVFTLVAVFIFVSPGMRTVAVAILKILVYLFEGIGVLVLGLGFVGHFGARGLIEHLDEKRASSISLEPWVHWLVAIFGAVVAGWLWTFVVEMIVSVPGYLQTLFVNWNFYSDFSMRNLVWWWVIGSVSFFFGYFWRGIVATIKDW